MNHLSDQLASSDVPAERQSTLDGQVRARIQSELSRLREEERAVREEIEHALEKENLDKERSMAGAEADAGAESESGNVKSSAALQGDLDEIQHKVDRFHSKRDLSDLPDVKAKADAVASCYQYVAIHICMLPVMIDSVLEHRANPTNSLDCWREVTEFKASVAQLEQVRTSAD